ncbi:MAG: hypothetical protein JWL90_453 [Chthoniobacteraceae bacterium]|nr:hypothetical protein [Chthoniobacteraceae bacterium]
MLSARLFGGILLAFSLASSPLRAAKPREEVPPITVAHGVTMRLVRDEILQLYDKPLRAAKAGETFEVIEVRASVKKVFLGVQDRGRLVAVSVPLDAVAAGSKPAVPGRILKADALFAGLIPILKLTIDGPEMDRLRKDPHSYVEVSLEEAGGAIIKHAGLKLKGSAGSFQNIDEHPGFSINTDKFKGGERFHGLKRFQLNNCAQDSTALNEIICGEIARKAGVPASRCTHALVSLNGRDMGIYVLKEGFTEDFLSAFFTRTDGHLYDGGFLNDIGTNMELDHGDPADKTRITEFAGAINEQDPVRQQERMAGVLDIDAFMRFAVMESLFCHWDGYTFNRNNYRVYENPETGRFYFILHGMDQMFGDAGWSMHRQPVAAVGSVLWRKPENKERYTAQLLDIYEKVIKPVDWAARAEEVGQRLYKVLAANNPEAAGSYLPNIAAARGRIADRMNNVRRQMEGNSLLKTLASKGSAELGSAPWVAQLENAQSQELKSEGRQLLYIRAGGEAGNGSWRLPIQVASGKYRFEAQIKVRGVLPVAAQTGAGAGLRISGESRPAGLKGETNWQRVSYDFVSDGGEQVLIIELRARAGEMWAPRAALRLLKLP